jgi:glycosyltransferase involved in cell wall biosynthesis
MYKLPSSSCSMTAPRVTALIDTYNHELFIARAIESVLAQDYPARNFEILVVDDGSTDRTAEIVRTFAPRLRVITKPNGGQASAFNVGIREARGEIIAFLDGDDWWYPPKLSRTVDFLDLNPNVAVLGHAIHQVDAIADKSFLTIPPAEAELSFDSVEGAALFRRMMCFFGTSRLAIRKEVALSVLPIPERILIEADEYLAIAATAKSRAALLAEPLTYYRLHAANHYHMHHPDERRLRRMLQSLDALAAELPRRLAAANVPPAAISALIDPISNSALRLKLRLDGGSSWFTFTVERAERRLWHATAPLGYRLYAFASLAAALLLPPRLFYRLRDRYASSRLRAARGILGEPGNASRIASVPVSAPTFEQAQTRQRIGDGPDQIETRGIRA